MGGPENSFVSEKRFGIKFFRVGSILSRRKIMFPFVLIARIVSTIGEIDIEGETLIKSWYWVFLYRCDICSSATCFPRVFRLPVAAVRHQMKKKKNREMFVIAWRGAMWIHSEKKFTLTVSRNFHARPLQIQNRKPIINDKNNFCCELFFYAAHFRASDSLNIFTMNSWNIFDKNHYNPTNG